MTHFLRLLNDADKARALSEVCSCWRAGANDLRTFEVSPEAFDAVPGRPFAYWVSDAVRKTFTDFPAFGSGERTLRVGLQTSDDFRFLRCWWEIGDGGLEVNWFPFAKGGGYSPFFSDLELVVQWGRDGAVMKAWADPLYGNSGWSRIIKSPDFYFRPGFTWSYRPSVRGSFRILPAGVVFSVNGSSGFVEANDKNKILLSVALANSLPFNYLVQLLFSRGSGGQTLTYEVGYVSKTPAPNIPAKYDLALVELTKHGVHLKRVADSIEETSHQFILPEFLRARVGHFDRAAIDADVERIQAEIDDIAFDLYGFSEGDRQAALGHRSGDQATNDGVADEDTEHAETEAPPVDALLSWAVGVAFGRFDWRLATGEREVPPESDPFDPVPAQSPGMVPEGGETLYARGDVLADDQGHSHDLVRLIEDVLARVEVAAPDDVRRWLQRDFFAFHLQRYSKSRRKAPIYWPLSATSGGYTLWVYYPSLSSQTLYIAVNDFLEPKLRQVADDVTALRTKANTRTRDDERKFEALQAFELELIELRDTLLKLAPTYKPNHNDGVQVSAAPLWSLFRHKPWQKVLKDTWTNLEKGDYDWAHLAMNYWPDRVREKCKTDKSLAIAHGLEHLYAEPEAKPKKNRGRKTAGDAE